MNSGRVWRPWAHGHGAAHWALRISGVMVITGVLWFYAYHEQLYTAFSDSRHPGLVPSGGCGVYNAKSNDTAPIRSLPGLVQELWRPYVIPFTQEEHVGSDGKKRTLPKGEKQWTEPLGKKILILDVDTRVDDGPGGMMSDKPIAREELLERTTGRLGHLMYSMVHGYDYRLVRAPDYPGRHGTWVKVPFLKQALKTHDIVIFMDADADFVNFEVPMEWILNLWGVVNETSLVLAKDPDTPGNRDSKGRVLLNTGFIVAQSNDRTDQILGALDECPSGVKYPGCEKWELAWAHEQRAFGEYVRYDFDKSTDIMELSFWDANSPWGHLVRHDWADKTHPRKDLEKSVLDLMMKRLHGEFLAEKDSYYRDFSAESYPLGSSVKV